MKQKVIHITIPKGYKSRVANGKNSLLPIYDEVCDPRIDSPEYVKMILKLWEQAKPKTDGCLSRNGKVYVTGTP